MKTDRIKELFRGENKNKRRFGSAWLGKQQQQQQVEQVEEDSASAIQPTVDIQPGRHRLAIVHDDHFGDHDAHRILQVGAQHALHHKLHKQKVQQERRVQTRSCRKRRCQQADLVTIDKQQQHHQQHKGIN